MIPTAGGERHERGLGNFHTALEQQAERDHRDRDGGGGADDLLADHDRGAGDRAGGGGGRALDEPLQPATLAVAAQQRSGDDHEQIDGQEHGRGREQRAGDAEHEIAGEGRHDHDRTRADQPHRDRVDELLLGQPVMVMHEPLVKERHDRQP